MRGLIAQEAMQDGLLPSYEEMEFLQDDDLYTEIFGHHEPHHLNDLDTDDEWSL